MSEQELAILQNVIMVLIRVMIPPLLAWGLIELKRYLDRLKQTEQWAFIEQAVKMAVEAAEQLGLTDQLSEYGDEKLDVAIQFVETQLAARGVPLDLDKYADVIRAMIEAEVKRQFPNE